MPGDIKKVAARWVEGLEFQGITGSGHTLVMDAMEQGGGKNHGPSPMELLLVGLAGCTGMDVIQILQKKRQQVSGLEVKVEGVRAETDPKVYTEIDLVYTVRGKDVSARAVERAIQLSEEKYCGAGHILRKTAQFRTRFEIIPD